MDLRYAPDIDNIDIVPFAFRRKHNRRTKLAVATAIVLPILGFLGAKRRHRKENHSSTKTLLSACVSQIDAFLGLKQKLGRKKAKTCRPCLSFSRHLHKR